MGILCHTLEQQGYHSQQQALPRELWTLCIHEERTVNNLVYAMRLSLTWPCLLTHWFRKCTAHMDLNQVAYRSLEHAMQQLPASRRVWVVKMFAGHRPVGKNMLRRKEWAHALCPRCGREEDTRHVWLCGSPSSQRLWQMFLADLPMKLREVQTHPMLREAIVQ